MGFRFRRRVTIIPGVSLNISKSGIGLSAGPRGAKVGIGPRGIHRSIGLPGTGIHFREETTWGALKNGKTAVKGSESSGAVFKLHNDGKIDLVDSNGVALSPRIAKAFRDEYADKIQDFLILASEQWNKGIDEILGVHLSTPEPAQNLHFEQRLFSVPEPPRFVPKKAGLLGFLWPPRRQCIEQENKIGHKNWGALVLDWQKERQRHENTETARMQDYERGRFNAVDAMERVFEDRLALLSWPRETKVSYQIRDQGRALCIDVDLPEIEDMPKEQATPAAKGLKLNIKPKSDTQIRREYMQHIHAVLFRLIGEAFYTLPTLAEVIASGYSQRPDPATGHIRDDYLVSAMVNRETWTKINFQNLGALDVVATFEIFDLRRNMTKTGIFKPIDPHVEGEA